MFQPPTRPPSHLPLKLVSTLTSSPLPQPPYLKPLHPATRFLKHPEYCLAQCIAQLLRAAATSDNRQAAARRPTGDGDLSKAVRSSLRPAVTCKCTSPHPTHAGRPRGTRRAAVTSQGRLVQKGARDRTRQKCSNGHEGPV